MKANPATTLLYVVTKADPGNPTILSIVNPRGQRSFLFLAFRKVVNAWQPLFLDARQTSLQKSISRQGLLTDLPLQFRNRASGHCCFPLPTGAPLSFDEAVSDLLRFSPMPKKPTSPL